MLPCVVSSLTQRLSADFWCTTSQVGWKSLHRWFKLTNKQKSQTKLEQSTLYHICNKIFLKAYVSLLYQKSLIAEQPITSINSAIWKQRWHFNSRRKTKVSFTKVCSYAHTMIWKMHIMLVKVCNLMAWWTGHMRICSSLALISS